MKISIKGSKLVILDIIIINITTLFAFYLRFNFNIPHIQMKFYFSMLIPMCILMYLSNTFFDLYGRLWKYASVDELVATVKSVTTFTVASSVVGYLLLYKILGYGLYRMPFSVLIISWTLNIIAIGGSRFILRIVDNIGKYNKYEPCEIKNTLIIGAGDAGSMLIKELKKHKEVEEYPVAVIDDDITKIDKKINGVPIIGDRSNIREAIVKYNIEEVIMAIPTIDTKNKKEIFDICKDFNVTLKTIPGIYEIVEGKVNISKIRNVNIEDLLGRDMVAFET